MPDYSPLEKQLHEPCSDPRAVLVVRKENDRSGRIWVQQALLAHPEFQIVPEKARAPFEVDFYETIYGVKNFSRDYPGQPRFSEAVVARCADVRTCDRVAAMFHAVSPRDEPELVCGVPPGTTGGFARVSELSAERRTLPNEKSALVAHCARIHACLARQASPRRPPATCAGIANEVLVSCSMSTTCEKLYDCIFREIK